MKNLRVWIIDWFSENGKIDKLEVEERMDENYVESGLIDSFAFIALVAAIEEEFKISFTEEDFESESLLSINGIISIVERRL